MEIEIEVTKKEKQIVKLETPAYFRQDYREVKVTEDKIIEVNDQICIITERLNVYSSFYEKLDKIINSPASTAEFFESALESLLNTLGK